MTVPDDLASIRSDDDEPAFAAPWEATAFALKAHLVATGVLDAAAFATLLGEEMRKDHAAQDEGTAYFVAYVTALERAIATIAPPERLAAEQAAWRAAAEATPHGAPIVLDRCRDKA
ncbi:nitrile hydratase accessory protein [Acuticoccus sp. M5D2P5]|uniref:nitrile hydratase accessory protein n=1 Tax=Acuticoccus kalidii TaxID=2910977 RepID=UPI001F1D9238|nr:nitrile hydratase accessory protein [Acuticoccus kalidii]MCF3933637.1 nitrile hydratase accessory protein [Acuticoccus kalidii]